MTNHRARREVINLTYLLAGIFFILACFYFIIVLMVMVSSKTTSHPTDEQMIAKFRKNKMRFEELIEMISKDENIFAVDETWYKYKVGGAKNDSNDKIDRYRKMLNASSIPRGFYAYDDGRILLIESCQGLVTGGSSKGYAYDKHPLSTDIIVNSIDEYDPSKDLNRSYWLIYKHIEGDWYLFCSYDD